MDIHAGIIAAAVLIVIGGVFAIRSAIQIMQSARKLSFYSLRRMRNVNAWRLFFLALLMFGCAVWLPMVWELAVGATPTCDAALARVFGVLAHGVSPAAPPRRPAIATEISALASAPWRPAVCW